MPDLPSEVSMPFLSQLREAEALVGSIVNTRYPTQRKLGLDYDIEFRYALRDEMCIRDSPTSVRYTGVGLAFNLSDGIIGGFTPAIALILFGWTGDQGAFCFYILLSAIISLISFLRIKE